MDVDEHERLKHYTSVQINVKEHRFYCYSDSTKTFSETNIINMLEFLIYNIFVMFGGRVFQQAVGMPMGTNCAPLLTDVFLYSHEADFIEKRKKAIPIV